MQAKQNKKSIWDKLGIALSGLCAIHCIGVSALIIAFPALQDFLADSILHKLALLSVTATAFFAFYPSYKKHKQKSVLILALIGIALLAVSILTGDTLHEHSHNHYHLEEFFISLLGSAFLIAAHIKNMKCIHSSCSH